MPKNAPKRNFSQSHKPKHPKSNPKHQKKEEIEEESSSNVEVDFDEEDEQDFEALEQEAKMLRDESISGEDEENDADAEFLAQGQDLDLPSEEGDSQQDDDESEMSDLEDYYAELGIQDEQNVLEKPEDQYKKTQKPQKVIQKPQVEQAPSKKSIMIEAVIKKATEDPSYSSVSRIIKIVKQIFNSAQEEEKKDENQKKDTLAQALNTQEYRRIFDFFVSEIAGLVLKVCEIKTNHFSEFEKSSKKSLDLKQIYGKMNTKQSMLMKTFAANYNKLLKQTISQSEKAKDNTFLMQFFINGKQVVQCCIPFRIYSRKLSNNLAQLCMQYSRIDPTSQMLIFNALFHMIKYLTKPDDSTFFQNAIKKMYLEFTKESKIGGGGHAVQNTLRTAQNCFVEMLGLNLAQSYQLGFLYIRQLCLHLRNTRNNLAGDAVKSIYSWQFYNCVKLWVLALCQHKQELVLLINPVVQLIMGTIKLSQSIKYFPFHLKLFELLTLINEKTNEFIPISQYLLYPFESQGGINYLNSKNKKLEDKTIPETLVSLKIAKKHLDTNEMKDRIVQEAIEHMTIYLATNSRDMAFPEMTLALSLVLRKFRKGCSNSNYRKAMTTFLEAVKANEDLIIEKRALLKDKVLKSAKLDQMNMNLHNLIKDRTPLEKEKAKILKRRQEKDKMKQTNLIDA